MGHTFSNLLIHVIFSTKGRTNLLYSDMREELYKYICGIAKNEKVQVLQINGIEDHIHMLLTIKPSVSISQLVKSIKVGSTNWIHKRFQNLTDFAWQPGFSAFSVSESAKEAVVEYIKTQKEHHHRLSYENELRLFLEKNGVPFNAEYYLD